MHPNAVADLAKGGWLGAKVRDLAIQAAHKSILSLIGTLCTQEAMIHRLRFGSLRNVRKTQNAIEKLYSLAYHEMYHNLGRHQPCLQLFLPAFFFPSSRPSLLLSCNIAINRHMRLS